MLRTQEKQQYNEEEIRQIQQRQRRQRKLIEKPLCLIHLAKESPRDFYWEDQEAGRRKC